MDDENLFGMPMGENEMNDTAWLVLENIVILICACLMVYYYSPWFALVLALVNVRTKVSNH
jgi:hypothetical protein